MVFAMLLKKLRGHRVTLTFGHPLMVERVLIREAIIWDLVHEDDLAILLITNRNAEPPVPAMNPGDPQPVPSTGPGRPKMNGYSFKFIRTENVIDVDLDTGVKVDVGKRRLTRDPVPPVYSDEYPGWELLDARVRYNVEKTLFDLGYRDEEPSKPGRDAVLASGDEIPVEVLVEPPVPAHSFAQES